MNRLYHVWFQLWLIATTVPPQRSSTTDAYGILITTSTVPRLTFRTAINVAKIPMFCETTAVSPTEPRSSPNATNESVVDAVSQQSNRNVNHLDKNDKATTRRPVVLSKITIPPTHWIDDTDQVIYQERSVPLVVPTNASLSTPATTVIPTATTTIPSVFHCTVRGNPLPLRRHRTRLGFMYNPSAATQLTFRNSVRHIIDAVMANRTTTVSEICSISEGHRVSLPLWNIEQPIAVAIVFRMKRPNSHFIANKPFVESTNKSKKNTTAVSRLRSTAPKVMCTTSMRTDIDNLAKFVLDSLNNVTYADDKQIVSLHVIKLFDNDMTNRYQGSTTITIRWLQDDDMTTHLIEQQQHMLSTVDAESIKRHNNMF